MRDARTRELGATPQGAGSLDAFLQRFRATLVMLRGAGTGSEFSLDRARVVVGRGDSARLRFDDDAMSREHAAFEFADQGFRVRDLASRNGTLLNGATIEVAELKHGDRIQLGEHVFQFVLEELRRNPRTWELPLDPDDSDA